jgi:CheY-like chemotaxis protein
MSGKWATLTAEHCLPQGFAMPNKALTVLIADEQHLRRLYIEKMLNQLGYYRIVPVQTFEEVQILTSIPAEPFDALIINAGLLDHAIGLQQSVHHVLVYEHIDLGEPAGATSAVRVRLPGVPDNVSLEHFMDIVDPSEAAHGLRVLPWLRELSRARVARA